MREIFRGIQRLISSHTNPYVEEWKSSSRPVVGYLCQYVPREIILAAGALPLRLRGAGSQDSSLADAYMSGRTCTYVRHVMSLSLDSRYDFLDGEIGLNTCDHVRRAADVFIKKTSIPYHGFISVPRSLRESLYGYYREELRRLMEGLGAHCGRQIDESALRQAIRTMNQVRHRLIEIARMRNLDRPLLSGAESLALHIASQVLPPDVFVALADDLIKRLKEGPGLDTSRGRLVLVGAELDEPEYVEVLESQGALVVADRLCFGARSVLAPIDEDAADPLDAIGRAYFFQPSCARMIGDFPARWKALTELVAETRSDGVVFERLVFCDPWGAELHNLLERAQKEQAFPILVLSREYGIVPTGQLKTRIQAFVEKLEIGRVKRRAAG